MRKSCRGNRGCVRRTVSHRTGRVAAAIGAVLAASVYHDEVLALSSAVGIRVGGEVRRYGFLVGVLLRLLRLRFVVTLGLALPLHVLHGFKRKVVLFPRGQMRKR